MTIEELESFALRMREHSDMATRRDVASDMKRAANIASAMATIRLRVREIAEMSTDPDTATQITDMLADIDEVLK